MNKFHHITVASYKDEAGKSRIGIFAAPKTFSKGGKLELVCAVIGRCVPTLTDAKNTLSGADMEYSHGWQRAAHYFAELCKAEQSPEAVAQRAIVAALAATPAPADTSLTLDYPGAETGYVFVMVGPKNGDGVRPSLTLSASATSAERLAKHWAGFAEYHACPKVDLTKRTAAPVATRDEHRNADYNIVQSGSATPMNNNRFDVIKGQRVGAGFAEKGAEFIAGEMTRDVAIALADLLQARHDAAAPAVYFGVPISVDTRTSRDIMEAVRRSIKAQREAAQ